MGNGRNLLSPSFAKPDWRLSLHPSVLKCIAASATQCRPAVCHPAHSARIRLILREQAGVHALHEVKAPGLGGGVCRWGRQASEVKGHSPQPTMRIGLRSRSKTGCLLLCESEEVHLIRRPCVLTHDGWCGIPHRMIGPASGLLPHPHRPSSPLSTPPLLHVNRVRRASPIPPTQRSRPATAAPLEASPSPGWCNAPPR